MAEMTISAIAARRAGAAVRNEADLVAIMDGAPMTAATSALPRRSGIGAAADQVAKGQNRKWTASLHHIGKREHSPE